MGISEAVLSMHPLIVILGFSLLVTFISVIAYKFLTNQAEMKEMKGRQKEYRQLMKDHKHDQKKLMEIQKKQMEDSLKMMQHSFKPMIFTFLPIIILFGWLHANLAYEPLLPGQEFNLTVYAADGFNLSVLPREGIQILGQTVVDGSTVYTLKGEEGTYTIFIDVPGEEQKTAEFIIAEKQKYKGPEFKFKGNVVKRISLGNEKMRPFGDKFNIFGYFPGWFLTYLISAIIFNSILRKLFRVH